MAGGLLTLPQPSRREGAPHNPGALQATRGRRHPAPGAFRRRGWRLTGGGPWFDIQYGVLTIDGPRIDVRIEKAVPDGEVGEARLERVLERRLA